MLHAHAISTAEDRLPNIMDDQHESLASSIDFQNAGGGSAVRQDHTNTVLFREERPVWQHFLKRQKARFHFDNFLKWSSAQRNKETMTPQF